MTFPRLCGLLLLLLLRCIPAAHPDPSPWVPTPVACNEADPACLACEHLTQLGCAEGCGNGVCTTQGRPGDTCAQTLRHVEDVHLTATNLPCIQHARSGAEVRACGAYWTDACQ